MTIKEWLNEKKATFKEKYNRTDAEIILCHVLKKDRAFLAIHLDDELGFDQGMLANAMLERRLKNSEPMAYILERKDFYGRDFYVDNRVLIPRSETETIIDLILEYRPKTLLDIGTGCGCIAISAKLENPKMRVLATDVSKLALKVAKQNAKAMRAAVEFLQGDLLDKNVKQHLSKMDFVPEMIVANLPYVDENWEWLDKKALGFEPDEALFATGKGLDLIYRLINELGKMKTRLVLEADPCQHRQIIQYATANGLRHEKTSGFQLVFYKD
ncbi:peptide chain release factor N(5)-glutamine methyltransferase [Candidatus Saccharibacteria bacterium]|nr:peptide chain release factor N(5)-glutamine methyltransferase [Candidatus Saccharibacteria bacterium]